MRKTIPWLAALAAILAFGCWLLVHPDNWFTRLFQTKIANVDAQVVVGPYPNEDDMRLLKDAHVDTIVTLLNPALPYEGELLQQEQALAQKYDIKVQDFPMSSILGQRFGSDYDANARKAADAIVNAPGKVYLHCYLGMHRAQVVEELVKARKKVGMYSVRQGERDEASRTLDRAQAEFQAGRYQRAIAVVQGMPSPAPAAVLLEGWSYFRLKDCERASTYFRQAMPGLSDASDAHLGLGTCALRKNDLAAADMEFSTVLKQLPDNPSAMSGLGIVRFRQSKLDEAARYLQAAVKADPQNEEAKAILAKIGAK